MAIDDIPVSGSRGFTISARSKSSPNLLDIKGLTVPIRECRLEFRDDWLRPSDDHWMHMKEVKIDKVDRRPRRAMSENVNNTKCFESEVEVLQKLIRQEETLLFKKFRSRCERMREELRECDGFRCTLNTIGRHARDSSKLLFRHFEDIDISDLDVVSLIPQTTIPINSYERPIKTALSYNLPPTSQSSPDGEASTASRPGDRWLAFTKILAASLGLGILLSFIRRTCCFFRKHVNRLTDREETLNACTFRRAAWRARWRNLSCFSCCARPRTRWRHRPQPPTNLDEKQRLVREQESVLDDDMHAQVNALCDQHAICSEIQSMRHSHGFIDALVRAEEGRNYNNCRGRSCSGIGMGFSNILHTLQNNTNSFTPPSRPSAAMFPNTYQNPYPYAISSSSTSSTRRCSRNSSPPPYGSWNQSQSGSEASTAPPDYRSEADDNDITGLRNTDLRGRTGTTTHHVADGFRAYEPELPMDSRLGSDFGVSRTCTPVSSVPELSPRPSLESINYGGCVGRASNASGGDEGPF